MAFIEQDRSRLGVRLRQFQLRHVKPGQPAEIAFKLYPGQTFSARVEAVIPMNAMGQIQASGELSEVVTGNRPYWVVLTLDDDTIDITDLPGGAVGIADVYTDRANFTHIVRHIELRMKSWLNYIIP